MTSVLIGKDGTTIFWVAGGSPKNVTQALSLYIYIAISPPFINPLTLLSEIVTVFRTWKLPDSSNSLLPVAPAASAGDRT